jgi:hypothetical protein
MFAEKPPSSSDPTKRPCRRLSSVHEAFRRLRLQIGGANIAGADRALERAYFIVARGRRNVSPPSSSAQRVARSVIRAAADATPTLAAEEDSKSTPAPAALDYGVGYG